jgi:hypothetical protein
VEYTVGSVEKEVEKQSANTRRLVLVAHDEMNKLTDHWVTRHLSLSTTLRDILLIQRMPSWSLG